MIHLVLKRYKDATGQSQELLFPTMLPTWTDKRLLHIVKDFANEKPTNITLCVFIDGLDEFVGDQDTLLHIIKLLSSAGGCKVCVSSRPDQTFRLEFQGYPQCRVQDLNHKDIEKMVLKKLKPCLEENKPNESEAIKELLERLIHNARGVFLWLSIMIKDFITASKHGDTISELHRRLDTTPDTIYGLYRRILSSLDKTYLRYALKTFQIMVAVRYFSARHSIPLTLFEFACMDEASWMHVEQSDRPYFWTPIFRSRCRELYTRLNARCGNLIDIMDHKDEREKTVLLQSCQIVDFIHRTVVEFLKDEFMDEFCDESCMTAAWIPFTRARIGRLFLSPFMPPFIEVVEPYTENFMLDEGFRSDSPWDSHGALEVWLKELISSLMLSILFGEKFSRAVDSEKPPGNVQSELTAQALQTLQHLTTTDDVLYGTPDQRQYGSMKQLVRKVLIERFGWNPSGAQFPLEDCMNFAAFWGWESYIRSHLSTETPDEQLSNILISVINGIYFDDLLVEGFPISFLNIAELLLCQRWPPRSKLKNQGLDDNAVWVKHEFGLYGLIIRRSSPWEAFLLQVCNKIEETSRVYGNSDLYGEGKVWIQRCLELVEDFLSEEANHNARIGLSIRGYAFGSDLFFFVDMTPLRCVQSFPQRRKDYMSLIETILKSKGAESRCRYRFCRRHGRSYRITPAQSKSFERLLFSTRYPEYSINYFSILSDIHDGDEASTVLQDIISTNDKLDEDTMEKEWARGGDGWLEEED
ncbi:MAG: hypothetical protein Q9180_005872 [Flavoplaca navasiana]